ncbi:hypothetical protein ABC347_11120 [Sphingomonas sp. 1P06PA]|uniref:hypothetical protein n=1 Tax=Sphingomonas sp. 1P06PA TaxID=554121 RepID=UPI0039A4B251
MTGLVARRQRIARVRSIQHILASAEAARAEARVEQLESTERRLALLSAQMTPAVGHGTGQHLSSGAEMIGRLAQVRDGLTDSIVGARASAEQQAALRIAARIRQESAERLGARAVRAAEAKAEAKRAALPRPRTPNTERDA